MCIFDGFCRDAPWAGPRCWFSLCRCCCWCGAAAGSVCCNRSFLLKGWPGFGCPPMQSTAVVYTSISSIFCLQIQIQKLQRPHLTSRRLLLLLLEGRVLHLPQQCCCSFEYYYRRSTLSCTIMSHDERIVSHARVVLVLSRSDPLNWNDHVTCTHLLSLYLGGPHRVVVLLYR